MKETLVFPWTLSFFYVYRENVKRIYRLGRKYSNNKIIFLQLHWHFFSSENACIVFLVTLEEGQGVSRVVLQPLRSLPLPFLLSYTRELCSLNKHQQWNKWTRNLQGFQHSQNSTPSVPHNADSITGYISSAPPSALTHSPRSCHPFPPQIYWKKFTSNIIQKPGKTNCPHFILCTLQE